MRLRRTVYRVGLSGIAQDRMREAAQKSHPNETGGLLLGWWDEDGIQLVDAVEVIDLSATGVCWTRSEATAQVVLQRAVEAIGDPLVGYVGDWHSHPAAVGPSSPDRAAITRISRQYSNPVVLVVHRADSHFDVVTARAGRVARSTVEEYES